MSSSQDKSPKVVDSIFGDDAWFLSGLGIDVASAPKQPEEKSVVSEVQNEDQSSVVSVVSPKETKKKEVYVEDFVPTLREARVITREEVKPQKPKKAENAVDELIKKKSQEAAYDKEFRKPAAKTTDTRRGWWGHLKFVKGKGSSTAAVTIGATKRTQKVDHTAAQEKKEKVYKVSDSLKKKATIQIGDSIVVKEFSEKMGVPLPEVMKVLLSNKILVAAQASIDFETASLVASEFDVKVEKETTHVSVEDILAGDLEAILAQDKEAEDLIPRPPVVTIMGHVDHGKTKLLDYIRKTDVVAKEAGGITQSIGASQITHNDQKITFIDTPWHELFTALRARGSRITNIVIIVVAADDGVKPQTVEAIRHAQDANVPIIVALTKIDLGIQKLEEIKGQLAQYGLQPEDRGGDVIIVPVSSFTWQGIDDLLDAVLLQYEMLQLEYSPSRKAVGVVVEAEKEAKQGVMTTLLIMTWTLRIGDVVVIHNTFGKVRKMLDRAWRPIKEAKGGDPVMILWIQDLPEPGRVAEVVGSEKEANKRISAIMEHEQSLSKEAVLQSLIEKIGKGDTVQLKLILKADSFGSLEAVKHATQKVALPENVEVKIIHADVGSINNGDVVFAQASGALVIGFNVTASGSIKKKAETMHVIIKEYDIIYKFIEYLEQVGAWMIEIEKKEVMTGELEVLGVFFKRGKEMIFGGKVTSGKAVNGARIKVYRSADQEMDADWNPMPFTTGTITSLQKDKENFSEVAAWHECGMKAKVGKKIEVGDRIEFYITE